MYSKKIKVTVTVAELRQIEKEQRQRLRKIFEEFNQEIIKNNEELLKIHKTVSSESLLYLIGLIFFSNYNCSLTYVSTIIQITKIKSQKLRIIFVILSIFLMYYKLPTISFNILNTKYTR